MRHARIDYLNFPVGKAGRFARLSVAQSPFRMNTFLSRTGRAVVFAALILSTSHVVAASVGVVTNIDWQPLAARFSGGK